MPQQTHPFPPVERYRGCLVGAAVGDALGMPLEFLEPAEVSRRYGRVAAFVPPAPGHPNERLLPGQYTDDTQLTIALAASLAEKGDFDLDDFAARLVAWHEAGDRRCPGRATVDACRRLSKGRPPGESGILGAAGAGTAMRAAPLGLMYSAGDQSGRALARASLASTFVTHRDSRAAAGTAAVAWAVLMLKRCRAPLDADHFLGKVCDFAGSVEAMAEEELTPPSDGLRFTERLEKVEGLLGLSFERGARELGNGGAVWEAVPLAFFAFMKSPNDFERAVADAANQGGDADTSACIAGALSGAYNGLEGIPAALARGVEDADRLIALADRLHAASAAARA